MNYNYYAVKPLINGFETVFIAYGLEEVIHESLKRELGFSYGFIQISGDLATQLSSIGFKIYMFPNPDDISSQTDGEDEI